MRGLANWRRLVLDRLFDPAADVADSLIAVAGVCVLVALGMLV